MTVNALALFELLVQPMYADLLPDYTGAYDGALHEFTVVDNVSLANGTPLVDIFSKGAGSILKRRDGSCKTDWSTVATTSSRRIKVTELYGAVEECQEGFYQGCLADLRSKNAMFRDKVLMYFQKLLRSALAQNSYFGDVTRAGDPTDFFSWNAFDGIFTKIAQYIALGTIPAAQHFSIPAGPLAPADAYTALKTAYDAQNDILSNLPDNQKAIYIDKKTAKAYERYLISIGQNSCCGVSYVINGIPTLLFEGIPIVVEPIWDGMLKALNGGVEAHAIILTISGNFIFGTDKSYGGGANLDQALRIWWSEDDEVWRYKMYLVAGTELYAPQHVIIGTTF